MDRAFLIATLAQAERHVAEGTLHVQRQREIIATLERDGHDTTLASDILITFEQLLASHISDRDRYRIALENHLREAGPPA